MSTQVTVGDFQVTSNAPADEVVASLTSDKPEDPKPVLTVSDGKPVPQADPETAKVSEAAATLGKKGAEAAAKAREAKEKEPEKEARAEEKAKEAPEAAKEPEPEESEEERKSRAAERVKEATRQAAEVKRQLAAERQERERLAREVAELRRAHLEATQRAQQPSTQPAQKSTQPAQVAPDNDPAPKQEDYDDYAEYVDARARHAARQEFRERERHFHAERQARAYAETIGSVVNKFHERLEKAGNGDRTAFLESISPVVAGLRPSFLLEQGETPTVHTVIADEIVDSEHSAGLMKHFTDHPEDFQRIASLRTPRDIAREMAKLEAKLDGATSGNSLSTRQPASRPAVSKAPPPIQPVTGAPPIAEGTGFREGMSLDDYASSWKPPKR